MIRQALRAIFPTQKWSNDSKIFLILTEISNDIQYDCILARPHCLNIISPSQYYACYYADSVFTIE